MEDEVKNENAIPADNKTPVEDPFKNLERKFDSFIDVISDAVTAPRTETITNNNQPSRQADDYVSGNEFEEAGFDDKQLKVLGKIVDVAVNRAVSTVKSSSQLETDQQKFDNMAFKKFPDLKNKNSLLYKAANEALARREVYDKKARTRPDALWSVAHEVQETIRASSESNSFNDAPRSNNYGASYLEGGRSSSGMNRPKENNELSDERKWVRQKLGISS